MSRICNEADTDVIVLWVTPAGDRVTKGQLVKHDDTQIVVQTKVAMVVIDLDRVKNIA